MQGLEESGTAPSVAKDLWKLNEAAADYSFNKSHAACYGLISYRTAYLKANYPAEYMAAVISSVMNTKDKVPFFVNRCEEMGIEVLPPDVNSSDHELRRLRERDPLRARRGQERRPLGGRGDPAGPRGDADRLDLGLLRAGRRPRRQQTRDRMPDQVRRPRLDRRHPQGNAGGAAGGPVGRPEGPGGRPARPGLDLRLRPSSGRRRGQGRAPSPAPAADLRRRVRPRGAAGDGEGDARHLSLLAPALRSRARRCGPGSTAALAELASKPDGAWVTVGGIVTELQEDPHQERHPDDVRDARRRRGPGRDAGLQGRPVRERGGDRARRGRPRPRPARPQGPRRDQARRPGGRALRARPGGDRRAAPGDAPPGR